MNSFFLFGYRERNPLDSLAEVGHRLSAFSSQKSYGAFFFFPKSRENQFPIFSAVPLCF